MNALVIGALLVIAFLALSTAINAMAPYLAVAAIVYVAFLLYSKGGQGPDGGSR